MANIEVDLWDNSGPNIISVAQADPTVWAGIAAQANALAAQDGFSITTGPLYNSPERTLDSIGAVQNWLAAQSNVSVKQTASGSSGPSAGVIIAGAAIATVLVTALILAARRAPNPG